MTDVTITHDDTFTQEERNYTVDGAPQLKGYRRTITPRWVKVIFRQGRWVKLTVMDVAGTIMTIYADGMGGDADMPDWARPLTDYERKETP